MFNGHLGGKCRGFLCLAGNAPRLPVLLLALSLLVLPAATASAYQQPEPANRYLVTHYGLSEGLPTKTVTDITYGRDGYLYLATVRGLVRMDGFHVDVYSSSDRTGLLSDRVLSVQRMDEGVMLTDENRLAYRFRQGKAELLRNPDTSEPITTSALKEVDQGVYFLLDRQNTYLADSSHVRILGPSMADYRIWDGMYIDRTIYLLNSDGFYVREPSGYRKIPMPPQYSPDLTYFTRMELVDGHLRIYGRQKSACYDPDKQSWCNRHGFSLQDENEEILLIESYEDGRYLVATTDAHYLQDENRMETVFDSGGSVLFAGLFELPMGSVRVGVDGVWIDGRKIFSPEVAIVDAVRDSDGTLWISTRQSGLYNIRENPFYNISTDFLINSYAVSRGPDGDLWAGSFYNGLARWNDREIRYYRRERGELPSNVNRMIAPLRDGGMLVSGWGAPPVVIRDDETISLDGFWPLFGPRTNVTEAFLEDVDGTWWLGTLEGLYQRRGERYSTFYDNQGRTLEGVVKIVASPFTDDLFFCTSANGLVLLRNNRFFYLSSKLPASSQHIRDAMVASPDTVWAASYNGGLQRYLIPADAAATTALELQEDQGFEHAGYQRIIADSTGYLWISSNSGLLRVSKDGLNRSADARQLSTNLYWYREENGLLDREFNGGSQSTGFYDELTHRIWLTNQSGVVSFDPYAFRHESPAGNDIRVQEITTQRNKYRVNAKDRLELGSGERSLTLRYAHLSLTQNLTDQIWIRTGRNSAWEKPSRPGWYHLQDLRPGHHTIHFSLEAGGPVLAGFEIYLEPYLYETGGFQVTLLLLIAGIAYLYWVKRRKSGANHPAGPYGREETGGDNASNAVNGDDPIRRYIDEHFKNPSLNMHLIAEELDTSRSSLYRQWKQHHSESLQDYITGKRLEHARHLLREADCLVTEAALRSGFSSQSYFSKVFKKEFGETPSEFAGRYE